MPSLPCMEVGCGEFVTYRGRCAVHSKDRERETHRTGRIEARSGRMYDRAKWQRTRRAQLAREPLCRDCGAIATEVDHVRPLEEGGDPWAFSNLQSLCASCHARKSLGEIRRRGVGA